MRSPGRCTFRFPSVQYRTTAAGRPYGRGFWRCPYSAGASGYCAEHFPGLRPAG